MLTWEPAFSQCDPPPAGIVGWWPGNGNTTDLVGGNNGTAVGTQTYGPGEVSQAFSFDGSSSYVVIPAAPDLNVGAGSGLSIEAWINPGDLGERPMVEWNNGSSSAYGVHFWLSVPAVGGGAGSIYANLVDTSGTSHNFSSAPGIYVTNTFQHVALTYNQASGIATLYYNGSAVATASLGIFTPQTTYPLYLGLRPGYVPPPVAMLEDDVSVYNRALSPTEIQAIYNAGTAGKCPNKLPPVIVQSPKSVVVVAGGSTAFSAVVYGSAPLSYQWLLNSTNLPGATNLTLTLASLGLDQIGAYALTASNNFGQATSSSAFLTETGYDNCVAPPSGLAGWWPLEGSAVDVVGVHGGALVGGVSVTNGEVGQALSFDGASGYLDLGAWNPGST